MDVWNTLIWGYFVVVTLMAIRCVCQRDTDRLILIIPGVALAQEVYRELGLADSR